MSHSIQLNRGIVVGGISLTKGETCTGSLQLRLDETIATGQTAFEINIAIDISAVKGIFIMSTKNITVKTNSSGSPTDTITLLANQPYLWSPEDDADIIFTGDVTKLYVANASGASATLTLEGVADSSP